MRHAHKSSSPYLRHRQPQDAQTAKGWGAKVRADKGRGLKRPHRGFKRQQSLLGRMVWRRAGCGVDDDEAAAFFQSFGSLDQFLAQTPHVVYVLCSPCVENDAVGPFETLGLDARHGRKQDAQNHGNNAADDNALIISPKPSDPTASNENSPIAGKVDKVPSVPTDLAHRILGESQIQLSHHSIQLVGQLGVLLGVSLDNFILDKLSLHPAQLGKVKLIAHARILCVRQTPARSEIEGSVGNGSNAEGRASLVAVKGNVPYFSLEKSNMHACDNLLTIGVEKLLLVGPSIITNELIGSPAKV